MKKPHRSSHEFYYCGKRNRKYHYETTGTTWSHARGIRNVPVPRQRYPILTTASRFPFRNVHVKSERNSPRLSSNIRIQNVPKNVPKSFLPLKPNPAQTYIVAFWVPRRRNFGQFLRERINPHQDWSEIWESKHLLLFFDLVCLCCLLCRFWPPTEQPVPSLCLLPPHPSQLVASRKNPEEVGAKDQSPLQCRRVNSYADCAPTPD